MEMTLLATISSHTLHLFCPCEYRNGLEVEELLKSPRFRAFRVEDVRSRARCTKCGRVGESSVTISYALPGMRRRPKEDAEKTK
jgi:hypothetical protein